MPTWETLPEGHRVPEGASFYEGEDDGHCRVIRPSGERCGAVRHRATGICTGHAGIGLSRDPASYSSLGHAEKRRRSQARAVLGISARRAATPVAAARVAAQIRAQDYADAIVDRPLDDPNLSTLQRQRAAIDAVELLFPQASVKLEVEMPQEADDVTSMGWQDMQALASRLLDEG